MQVDFTTLTTVADGQITTTVHKDREEAVETLRENYDADFDGPWDEVEPHIADTQPDVLFQVEDHTLDLFFTFETTRPGGWMR